MTWRGSTDTKDRFFAALVYLFPLYDALSLGSFLFNNIPALLPVQDFLSLLLTPIAVIYGLIPGGWGNLVLFFVLFLAVVRNEKIKHFIRFNTMQAILIDIALTLIQIILQVLGGLGLIGSVAFIVATAACLFSMFQSALGRYAEIPGISQTVYDQLPR